MYDPKAQGCEKVQN